VDADVDEGAGSVVFAGAIGIKRFGHVFTKYVRENV
jgi:hypothetical protein